MTLGFREWKERNPLARWRMDRKLSQGVAALKIGVSLTIVMRWEAGVSVPKPGNMLKIAALIGVPVSTLSVVWSDWLAEGQRLQIK